MMAGRKTLEINANHPVIIDLLAKVKASESDEAASKTAEVLFQTALIESGFEIADPSSLVSHGVQAHVQGAWCESRCSPKGDRSA